MLLRYKLLTALVLGLFLLGACNGKKATAPTQDVDALLTSVVETANARITQTVKAEEMAAISTFTPSPTETPPPTTATPTSSPTLMAPPLVLASSTPTLVPIPTLLPGGQHCLRAQLTYESIPDGTKVSPGQWLEKKWRILNIGGCTWTTDYDLVFYDGERMGGPLIKSFHKEVPPGDWITFTLELRAPTTVGQHKGSWIFRSDKGEIFGVGYSQGSTWIEGPVWIDIYVKKP